MTYDLIPHISALAIFDALNVCFSHLQVLPVAAESALSDYVIAVREFLAAAPTETLTAPWEFYHFNAARSVAIGALRALPDTRDARCVYVLQIFLQMY